MFLMKMKNFISTVAAVFVAFAALVFAQGMQISRFPELDGSRVFYLRSASSQALIKKELSFTDLFRVKGESVAFSCADRETTLAELMEKYGAEILFEERAGGSVSYYCVTEKWTDGVTLGGVFVNLQIAFNGENCAVGAPLIFGGF